MDSLVVVDPQDIISSQQQTNTNFTHRSLKVFDNLDISENTRKEYQYRISQFLEFIKKNGFTRNSYLEYKRQLSQRTDLSISTKNKYLIVARIYCKELHKQGFLPTDITQNVKSFQQSRKHKKDVIKGSNWDKCREWVELFLTGHYNVEESLSIMTARGLYANKKKDHSLAPVSVSKAYTFFKDIYNTGMFNYHDELHRGSHPPLMTMAEFKKIRNIIEKRGGKKPEAESLPHIGIFDCDCGCGSRFTGERHTRHYLNGNSQEFNFYRSTRRYGQCKEQAVPEREMEAQIASYIDNVEMVPEFLEWLKKVIKRQNKIMYQHEVKEQELQSKRLAEITRKKYDLKDMKNEGFFPNDEEYQKQKADLLQQEQLIRQEVATTDSSVWDSLFEDMCNFSQRVKELYNSDDPNIKRMVVEIIGLNFKIKDKKLRIKAKNAWIALHWVKKQLWEKNLVIEPQIMLSEEPKRVIADPSIFYGAGNRT